MYAAELGISLFSDIDRYSLEDASITLSFHLKAGDETYEEVPMGIFYIAEANRKIKTLELKAYDAMLNLDKNFDKGLSSAFPYDFLSLLSKAVSCRIGTDQRRDRSTLQMEQNCSVSTRRMILRHGGISYIIWHRHSDAFPR